LGIAPNRLFYLLSDSTISVLALLFLAVSVPLPLRPLRDVVFPETRAFTQKTCSARGVK
jgi:hypothetical protein